MPILFDEDFESYAVGTNLPFGPWGGSGGSVAGFGVNPSPHQCINGNGTFTMFTYTIPVGDTFTPISLFMSFAATEDPSLNTGMIVLSNAPVGSLGQELFVCGLDGNSGLGLVCPSGYLIDNAGRLANSNIQKGFHIEKGVFYYLQLNITMDVIDHGGPGTETITVAASADIDGVQVCNGNRDTGILQSNVTIKKPQINRWEFRQPNGLRGGAIDNLTAKFLDSTLPHPALPADYFNRVSQMVVEVNQLPNDSNTRISQMLNETLSLPTDENIRISQMVIEIIQNGVPSPITTGKKWIVQEI